MFENPRRGRQARSFTTNVPKILDLKSSSEQIFSRKLSLGAPDTAVFSVVTQRSSPQTFDHKHKGRERNVGFFRVLPTPQVGYPGGLSRR